MVLVFPACFFFPGQKHMLEWWYHKGREPGKPRSPGKASYEEGVNLWRLALPESRRRRYTVCSHVAFTCTERLYFSKTIRSLRGKRFHKKTRSSFLAHKGRGSAAHRISPGGITPRPPAPNLFFLSSPCEKATVCLLATDVLSKSCVPFF